MSDDAVDKQDYCLYIGRERWDLLQGATHNVTHFRWGELGQGVRRDVTHVRVYPSVRAIKDYAFNEFTQLTNVILNDGLEEIGEEAFRGCASLVHITIPPAVRAICRNSRNCLRKYFYSYVVLIHS